MIDKRTKPVPGHKRAAVSYGVRVTCECGWLSCTWYGNGASSNAHGEWRGHAERCHKAALQDAVAPVEER